MCYTRTELPLENTTDFSFWGDKDKAFTPNYPYEKLIEQFSRHQALIAGLAFTSSPDSSILNFQTTKFPSDPNTRSCHYIIKKESKVFSEAM